jgi:hypothetical protein
VTLNKPLSGNHPAGDWAGTEFTQYRWYPDVQLDNIFWHDHVDGIHSWGHGLVGQLIVEPEGSTYHDPKTGAEVDSGTIVDIHTSRALAPGLVDGSFREMALWEIDDNPNTDGTLNLKAEPWADRLLENPDPSLLFSSYTHGDPFTPLPRAYPGDPFVIRTIQVGPTVDGLHVDGHRFVLENRNLSGGKQIASTLDTLKYGISERFTLVLDGGAGGPQHRSGDYLYMNELGSHFRQGAWGIIRVLPGSSPDLQPLPGTTPPPPASLPTQTGGRPPEPAGPGDPCPVTAPVRSFNVAAVDLPSSNASETRNAFVPAGVAAAAESGTIKVEPLVLHVAAGDCVSVQLTNRLLGRTSFHVGKLLRTTASSGIDVGFNPENTVAPGATRTYRLFADTARIGSALITEFGSDTDGFVRVDATRDGLYGAIDVAPAGSTFTDPVTGAPRSIGTAVDVHPPVGAAFRDFTLFAAENDPEIGQSHMPYPEFVAGQAQINYQTAGPRPDNADAFSSAANGDPRTPILRAYAGDPMVVHVFVAPGSEQVHSFSLGGVSFPEDPLIADSEEFETRGITPWGSLDASIVGGAGGRGQTVGDLAYGDLRRPFALAGMWGLQRILPRAGSGCPLRVLEGTTCTP